jgi:hypothetical protein
MIDLGEVNHILGLRVLRDENQVSIDQRYYVENVLKKFGMDQCKPVSTPIETSTYLLPLQDEEEAVNLEEYRSAVGALNYAAMVTRPDIATAVGIVARYVQKPGNPHWAALKRIFRYLRGTIDFGLVYNLDNKVNMEIVLDAYSDADWAGDCADRKSTTGYVMLLAGAAVSWRSGKHRCIAQSTCEAELIAANEATKELVWLRRLLEELGFDQSKPVTLRMDNNGARQLANNRMISQWSKHIDIRYHYIRDIIESNQLMLEHIASENDIADIFTKSLPVFKSFEF